ncbi:hypothetical protein GGQ64_004590 [Rhizobium azooxidifex]|uniref:Uncharacterized protein n=1 Tax=Mycoplana azooxidifex TaxID=1636188 RepID=A0A7W6DEW9_9HYPH|nr:hypothetical protein [Mycoplana azooxidifex]MBB3979350.1 hypothetical protein [Mycoplana azooxidifex]
MDRDGRGSAKRKCHPKTAVKPVLNGLDNMVKFDDMSHYPQAAELTEDYPKDFIEMKVGNCPDRRAYADAETKLYNFLCSYPEDDMIELCRHMHYEIHKRLFVRDFGEM